MKNFNKRGFGMASMLILIVVLILFVIIFSIIAYNSGLDKASPTSIYDTENIED